MDTADSSAPGFAITNYRRPRSAVAARSHSLVPGENRHDNDAYSATIAGSLDALADGLAAIEDQVEVGETTLDPETADAIRSAIAHAGIDLIDARFSGQFVAQETIDGLRSTILVLESELAAARRRRKADALELASLTEKTRTLASDLMQSRRSVAIERAQVNALETRVADLEAELDGAVASLQSIRLTEVKQLKEQTNDFQLALQDMQIRLLAQHRETENCRIDNDLLRAQLSDTEALLRATHSELVKARTGLANANLRIDALIDDAERLEDLTESQESMLAEERAENELMEAWLNGALSRYSKLQTKNQELEAMLEAGMRAVA